MVTKKAGKKTSSNSKSKKDEVKPNELGPNRYAATSSETGKVMIAAGHDGRHIRHHHVTRD